MRSLHAAVNTLTISESLALAKESSPVISSSMFDLFANATTIDLVYKWPDGHRLLYDVVEPLGKDDDIGDCLPC